MHVIVAALAAFFMSSIPALADATTSVSVPIGDILGTMATYIALALSIAVTWGLRFLPGQWASLAKTAQVDQLLHKAIAYGINSVAGAEQGKTLTIPVGNAVLAQALTYALQHGPELTLQFAGSPVDLAEKIWARLNLAADVSKPDFYGIAAKVAIAKVAS